MTERCASYYQNLNQQMQRLGDPVRCRLERGHISMHEHTGRGRAGTTRWPDTVAMIHPWQARATAGETVPGHGPDCRPDSKHPGYWICVLATHPPLSRAAWAVANHQHEAWQLQESAKGGWYCAACGQDVQLTQLPPR